MTDEHLCVACPQLRPEAEPRHYDRAQVCDGCRARLRALLAEVVDNYALLTTVPGSAGGAKVSGSRTPPLPLRLAPLDLTMPPKVKAVEDDLQPEFETVQTEVAVWQRPVLPTDRDEYPTTTVEMSRRRRRRDPNGWLAYGPSGDQVGDPSTVGLLELWCRDWQTRQWATLPDPTVSALSSWLTERLEWACDHHPAIHDFASELRHHVAVLWRTAGMTRPPVEYKFAVPCRECEMPTLYRWPGSDYVECGECPVLMTLDEYERWTQLIASKEHQPWVKAIAERHAATIVDGGDQAKLTSPH